MPLEGEKNGQQSSGHGDETGTHQVETPRHKSTTQQPRRTPYDQRSNGEDRGVAVGHREAAGARDEVGERYDDQETSNRVDEERSRRGEAKDDEEDREDEGRPNEGEERRTAATIANVNGQYTTTEAWDLPPESPPFPHHPAPQPPPSSPLSPPSPIPPTSPPYPERRGDDVDTTKSNKTPARRRADAVHDPGGETKKPPSVRLEGESGRQSSLHVETDDVETDNLKTCKTAAQRMCADALHNPGGQTDAPGSQPPSIRLEGEKDKASSLYVEADHVEADNNDVGTVDHDHDTQQSPRRPVGTPDGDKRRPSEPTEPPDEKHGE
ncbi:hypothetical protein PAXINDRAFT_21586 [Paxillus involutus ATCC 200175]|uniref:Uncharacterized protein n=1 Tax=Paxillus involutus ATCC 200175 TaxID=664439 RepID=A0A0C9TAA8_PAXIN|nr:hypothetical protein PAXINDRAFT_21586 [Paxillus involutus ATCC 200175]